ncbi:MAG: YdcF family protein [Ruminococcaceae bacterium]|nr:YdcF family protein [Oscillospiraceae bacterium]
MKATNVFRWLMPVLFGLVGVLLYFFMEGHSFLGILAWAVAVLCLIDCLLHLWGRSSRYGVKVVRTVVSSLVILTVIAGVLTLPGILRGPEMGPEPDTGYLLVLGAGVYGSEPSPILHDRIQRAYTYLTDHPEVICIASGGKGDDENISEARCIFDRLTAMGIAPERIWMEDRATSTVENFRYALALVEEKTGTRPETIAVLSNEFHLYRASLMAADQGVEATFVSAPTGAPGIRVNYTLREIFALWNYLIFGG